jgi:hypothetical protein
METGSKGLWLLIAIAPWASRQGALLRRADEERDEITSIKSPSCTNDKCRSYISGQPARLGVGARFHRMAVGHLTLLLLG